MKIQRKLSTLAIESNSFICGIDNNGIPEDQVLLKGDTDDLFSQIESLMEKNRLLSEENNKLKKMLDK